MTNCCGLLRGPIWVFIWIVLATSNELEARIGDSKTAAESRYGKPLHGFLNASDGTEYTKYKAGRFCITQYYLNGYAIHTQYVKTIEAGTESEILMDELKEVLNAESRGAKWELLKKPNKLNYFGGGYAVFENSDGVMLEIMRGKKIINVKSKEYFRQQDRIAEEKERKRQQGLKDL